MNFWETIILFFAFQSVLIGSFFFFKKQERYANRIFACFLFCFGYCITYNVLFWSKLLVTPSFFHLNLTFLLPQSLLAPLFYFYLRKVIDQQKIQWRKDIIHFVPFLLLLFNFAPYFLQSLEQKLFIRENRALNEYILFRIHFGFILTLLMLLYSGWLFFKYNKQFKEDVDLGIWFKTIYFSFLGCCLSYLIYYTMSYSSVLEVEQDYIITLAMAICILIVSYFSFHQPEVFNGKPIREVVPVLKYQSTSIATGQSDVIKERLVEIMVTQKPYLQSDLRLTHLAKLLDIPRHHASQVINENFQQNFNDFINHYRIQMAIKLIQDDNQSLNMKEIAYRVGFNNYVSFYKAFKRMTGQVPKDFKKTMV